MLRMIDITHRTIEQLTKECIRKETMKVVTEKFNNKHKTNWTTNEVREFYE